MPAAVETMAYLGEVPWHGLGVPVNSGMDTDRMLKEAGLDWTVSKRKMFLEGGTEVPNNFALVRDTDNRVLDVVGSTYKPVQNHIAMEFFDKFVRAGHMEMETAGSLSDGHQIWCLARIKADFNVGTAKKRDDIQNYLLLSQPHRLGKSMQILLTTVRVVCWNTLQMALRSQGGFRMPHSIEFDDNVKKRAEMVLGIAVEQVNEYKESVKFLASKRASEEDVDAYFGAVMQFDKDADEAKKKKDGEVIEPRLIPMFRHALEHAPGQELPTAKGTWWGALNAVTYVVDHEVGRANDTRLKTAWFGMKSELKREALKVAVDLAKAA